MAKRRKAPKRAAVSESEDEAATEIHEPSMRWQAEPLNKQPDTEAQSKAQSTIDDLEAAGKEWAIVGVHLWWTQLPTSICTHSSGEDYCVA